MAKEIPILGENKMAFLQFLVNGKVDVFYYDDLGLDRYFIEAEDGKLEELKSETRTFERDNQIHTFESKPYVGLLNHAFQAAPDFRDRVEKLSLNQKSLTSIAVDYHNAVCKPGEACEVYKRRQSKPEISFGVAGGFGNSIFRDNLISEKTLKSSYEPSIGIFFNTKLPAVSDRLSLYLELTYNSRKFSNDHVLNTGSIIYEHFEEIEFQSFRQRIALRWFIFSPKLFAQIGIFFDPSLTLKRSGHNTESWPSRGFSETKTFNSSNGYWARGANVGLGVDLRRVALFAMYEAGDFSITEKATFSGFSVNASIPIWRSKW